MKINKNILEFENMRSSGPGGQNANRRETGVRLRVQLEDLPLSETEEQFLRNFLPPKNLTKEGEVIVKNSETRSQNNNKKRAVSNLKDVLEEAIEKGNQEHKDKKRKRRMSGSGGGGSSSKSAEDQQEKQKRRRRSETTDDLLEEAFREDPETLQSFMDENKTESEES